MKNTHDKHKHTHNYITQTTPNKLALKTGTVIGSVLHASNHCQVVIWLIKSY